MNRPNIVLIMVDQQRMDMLGCYGHSIVKTPHIDSLATRGVMFNQSYCTCLPCSPSRATVFTGRYPHQHGVLANSGTIATGIPTLATVLGNEGYQLGYAGKWHVDKPKTPTDHAFTGLNCPNYGFPWDGTTTDGLEKPILPDPESVRHYLAYAKKHGLEKPLMLEQRYREDFDQKLLYGLHSGGIETSFESMVCDHAEDLFDQCAQTPDKPFFIWANFWGPHRPHIIPEPYYSMYDPDLVPEDPAFSESFAGKPEYHRRFAEKSGIIEFSWQQWAKVISTYWGYITMIDELVGRLVSSLKTRGLLNNTVVIFTADHGDMMGAHKQFEKGPTPYEETWRIPLISAMPDPLSGGSVCDEFVYLHDLLPTFAKLAGSSQSPESWQRDLSPIFYGRKGSLRRAGVYLQFFSQIIAQEQRIYRTRDMKLVYNVGQAHELYDLSIDPHQMTNRYDERRYNAEQNKLHDEMRNAAREVEDPIADQLFV